MHHQVVAHNLDQEIAAALAANKGVLKVRDLPSLTRTLERRARTGQLIRVLPNILIDAKHQTNLLILTRALSVWQPDAVVTGPLAAHLLFWPELQVDVVTASIPVRVRTNGSPFYLINERFDPALVTEIDGIRIATPAFAAVDMAADDDGAAIDEVLRRGVCTLTDLRVALDLSPRRRGNRVRRQVLWASRAEPWSQAERRTHRLLREGRVTGWVTNHRVRCGEAIYYLDVAFLADRVALEIDGYGPHSQREQFLHDRRRWTDLQAAGWLIVHLSWKQLDDPSWVLERVRQLRTLSKFGAARVPRRRDTR